VGLHVFGYVAESTQAAPTRSNPGWHEMFAKISRERGFAHPTRAQFDATSGPNGASSWAIRTPWPTSCCGSPSRWAGSTASHPDDQPRLAHADLLRGIELLGTEVAPRVAGA
jgi:hypothetical protein